MSRPSMRLPRVQFTIGWMMVAVAIIALLLGSVAIPAASGSPTGACRLPRREGSDHQKLARLDNPTRWRLRACPVGATETCGLPRGNGGEVRAGRTLSLAPRRSRPSDTEMNSIGRKR